MIIDELIVRLGFNLTGQKDLSKFQSSLQKAENSAKSFAATIGGALATLGLVQGLRMLSSSFIDINAQMQALESRFQVTFGSDSAGAKAALNWAIEFGNRTALTTQQAADSFLKLKQVGIDPTAGSLQALTDIWVATGGGAERFDRVMLAMTQALSAGALHAQDANQLAQAGIPIWNLLAETLGKTVGEVRAMSAAGDITNDVMLKVFDTIERKYSGAATNYIRTWAGATDLARGNWERFLRRVGQGGKSFQDLTDQINKVNDWIDKNRASVDALAESIGRGLTSAITLGAGALEGLAIGIRAVYNGFSSLSTTLKVVLGGLAGIAAAAAIFAVPFLGPLLAVGAAFAALGLAIQDVYTYINGGDSVLGRFVAYFTDSFPHATAMAQELWKTIQGIGEALGLLDIANFGKAGTTAVNNLDMAFTGVLATVNAIAQVVQGIIQGLQTAGYAINSVQGAVSDAANWIGEKTGLSQIGALTGLDKVGQFFGMRSAPTSTPSAGPSIPAGISVPLAGAVAPAAGGASVVAPTYNNNVTINAPSSDPSAIATAVGGALQDNSLRQMQQLNRGAFGPR